MLQSVAIAVALRAAVLLPPADLPADRPPAEVGRLIEQLTTRRGSAQDAAVEALARFPAAEPYLRPLLDDRSPLVRRQAAAAVAGIRDRSCRRALDQHAEGWARAGRMDMLVEIAALTQDGKLACRAADLAFRVVRTVRSNLNERKLGPRLDLLFDAAFSRYDTYELFSKGVGFRRVSSGELPGETIDRVFAHSPTFWTEVSHHKSKWVCLVGDRLTETNPRSRGWYDATLAVNNSVEMSTRFLYTSLLIADGDVELRPQPGGGNISLDGSVIIAGGSIRAKESIGVGGALLCAGGDITAGDLHGGSHTYLYAGGRVRLGKVGAANPAAGKPVVKEGADVSFTGVRFFELSDVGVDAAAVKGGARITKIDPRSPLAFYGLKVGDVVTKLNGQPMTSVNEFRRHARRSVVLRAGIFHVRRGDESLSRIVYFDGLLASRK